MSNGSYRIPGSRRAIALASWLISLSILALLAGVVACRQGNLAWDDADYLRRALANARVSEADGPLMVVPRAIDCLLHEHPKPPGLVAWIQLGALVLGRHHLDGLIVYASVVPYAFLLASVVYLGRRLSGDLGGLVALLCLIASPYSLSFGGKVMVETFLSLWILLTYALTCLVLEKPSRRRGVALGIVVGLAFLTKLTTILFLPGPLACVLIRVIRGGPDRRALLKSLVWSAVICAVVAGPWYALNSSRAIKFARFSSNYNELGEGRPDRISSSQRLVQLAADLAGWPMAATLACSILFAAVLPRKHRQEGDLELDGAKPTDLQATFSVMAWLGAGTAAAILLCPAYFDPRFLLPIWPVLAVDLGRRFALALPRFHVIPRMILGSGLATAVVSTAFVVVQVPTISTYWSTAALIDDLVRDYGIYTLGNVGNCAEWNVCKTGLINELRDQPANCFVLHDLTKLPVTEALKHLPQFDAIVVLGQVDLPESLRKQTPQLNRSYDTLARAVADDPTFFRVTTPTSRGLPELSVYIHKSSRDGTEQLSRRSPRKRRL